ncbi:MAG: ATP-binding protein [Candidatus Omnitrophota bacterium]
MPLRGISIRWKLTFLIMGVTFTALAVAGTLLYAYQWQAYRQQAVHELKSLLEFVALNTKPAILFDDAKAARENLSTVAMRKEISRAVIYKPDGSVFAESGELKAHVSPRRGPLSVRSFEWRGYEAFMDEPIFDGARWIGTLHMHADLHYLVLNISRYLIILMIILGATLVGTFLLSMYLQKMVSAPILEVAGIARRIRDQKDYSIRITKKYRDTETGHLVEALNQMLAEIQTNTDALENANRELQDLDRLKTEIILTVSHELRTPLHTVQEALSMILDGMCGDVNEEQRGLLTTAKQNIRRLAALINNLLDLQKMALGPDTLQLKPCDINELIRSMLPSLEPIIRPKAIELKTALSEPLHPVLCDGDKIIQVLFNLLHNAIKFTEKGVITVSSAPKDDKEIWVCVCDTGIGFNRNERANLFQAFVQLESGKRKVPGGSGLGLLISKKIIEAHHGRIWVESEEGKGSAFYFSLPYE